MFPFTVYSEPHGSVMGSGSFSPNCPFRISGRAIKWRGASLSAAGCSSLRERAQRSAVRAVPAATAPQPRPRLPGGDPAASGKAVPAAAGRGR